MVTIHANPKEETIALQFDAENVYIAGRTVSFQDIADILMAFALHNGHNGTSEQSDMIQTSLRFDPNDKYSYPQLAAKRGSFVLTDE